MTKPEQIADFVRRNVDFIYDMAGQNLRGPRPFASGLDFLFVTPSARPSIEDVARQIVQMGEFRSLQLGGFLATPNGQLIAQGVELELPLFYREDVEFLVAVLTRAAELQREDAQAAGRVALGATLVIVAVIALALRGSASTKR